MLPDRDVVLLARAFAQRLVTLEQISDVLRELERDESASVSLWLQSRGLASHEQVGELLNSRTLDAVACRDLEATSAPMSELPSSSAARSGRGSTFRSDPDEATIDLAPAGDAAGARANLVGRRPATGESATELESRQQFALMMEIGRGGLGRVRVAYDRQIAREVAVKELLPQSLESAEKVNRFLREAKVTGQLEHPGIVPIYATGLDRNGNPFYVMKRIGGRPLVQAIREYHGLRSDDPSRPRRLNDLLATFGSICQTMAFVHGRGVLHRDLKPQNIITGDFGEAIIVDWGLAKILGSGAAAGPDESTLTGHNIADHLQRPIADDDAGLETQMGSIVGTIAYMSPEQARGEPLDQRSDIFSLGAILYEILTGRPPYRGKGAAILEQVKQGEIRDPRAMAVGIPRALGAVCAKALAKDRVDRYATAKELASEIALWQSGEPPLAYREPLPERAYRWMKRHRTLCQVTAASIAVFVTVFGAWSWEERRRLTEIEERAGGHVQSAWQLFARGRTEAASQEIAKAVALAAGERRLQTIQGPIEDLESRIAARQKMEIAERQTQVKLAEFDDAYDTALFHSLLATQPGGGQDHRRAFAAAERGLALFPLAVDTNRGNEAGAVEGKSTALADIHRRQQELLFVQADLVSRLEDERDQGARAGAALAILDRIDNAQPLRAVYLRRARYLALAGKPDLAKQAAERAAAIEPQEALDLFILGDERLEAEDFAGASRRFQQALAHDPNRFWAQCFLAMAEVQMGQYDEAIANLTACAGRRPEFAWTYLLRGLAYGQRGDAALAEADFETALRRSEHHERRDRYAVFINRGIVRLRLGRIAAAMNDFRTAIEIDPKRWEGLVNLAEALRVEEDRSVLLVDLGLMAAAPMMPVLVAPGYRAALAQLSRAIELAPSAPRPYLARGLLWRRLKDADRAVADFRNAAAVARDGSVQKADAYCQWGRICHQRGEYQEALRLYGAALAARSDHPDALYLRGLVLMDLNEPAEAIAALDQYLEQSGISAQVHESRGRMDTENRAEMPADGIAGETIGPRSKLAALYRERALARMKLRDTMGAFHDSMLAVDLMGADEARLGSGDRDRFANLLDRRGWALLTQGAQLAHASFDEAIRLEPDVADAYIGRGSAAAQLGKYQEAIADAEAALAKPPVTTGTLYNAASIYSGLVAQLAHDPDPPPAVAGQSSRWIAEATRLLRMCLDQLPVQRRAFLLKQYESDRTFDSIRDLPEVKQLIERTWKTVKAEQP